MTGPINRYGRQLCDEEIEAGIHRRFVGGMWEEIGPLQLAFLVEQGLQPGHHLLDVGCGALRGGLHFIRYLEPGHYCGIDSNESLVRAGQRELDEAGLAGRGAMLIVDDRFRVDRFRRSFDHVLAVSLFTHLPMNHIVRCLAAVAGVLAPGGSFHATFFPAPYPAHVDDLVHPTGGITSRYDADPYHYAPAELGMLAGLVGLDAELVGDWGHPRGQQMMRFAAPAATDAMRRRAR